MSVLDSIYVGHGSPKTLSVDASQLTLSGTFKQGGNGGQL